MNQQNVTIYRTKNHGINREIAPYLSRLTDIESYLVIPLACFPKHFPPVSHVLMHKCKNLPSFLFMIPLGNLSYA